jgi:hypothetical protein
VVVLHAVLLGQSAVTLQPHAPATHTWPFALVVQLTHTPAVPHAVALLPAWQVPLDAAEQQPPLQVCVELHAVTHLLVALEHE